MRIFGPLTVAIVTVALLAYAMSFLDMELASNGALPDLRLSINENSLPNGPSNGIWSDDTPAGSSWGRTSSATHMPSTGGSAESSAQVHVIQNITD
ncbi:hypothetical protein [Pseudooceanicola algae]|uniref:Uncharacterized protein n=1 Tax=Pseudooceanicola algae TaxID=1537215 RepID=A0A418SHU8_9RHOB|nr:hypothetical protein [Pseudooceanicola algae]QPM92062.1 hypothetical protein PSAL_033250 [Pseudooceanicola algae]